MGFWTRVRFPSSPPSIHTSTPLNLRGKGVCIFIFGKNLCTSYGVSFDPLKFYGLNGTFLRLQLSPNAGNPAICVYPYIFSKKIGETGDFGYNPIKNARLSINEGRALFRYMGYMFKIPDFIGYIGYHFKPLRKKSMLRRAKHGQPCPNIPDFPSSFQRHTGFPSREGKLLGAKGLEFPKNSPRGWVGTEQAHSRILRPFPTNP